MKKLFFILLLLPLFSCHHSKKAQQDNTTTSAEAGNMRFIVSFYSIGSGTDHKAIELLDKFIPEFEAKNNVKIKVEKTRWGKEGEIDYCFKLDELKAKQQEAFIKETTELLKDAKHVRLEENMPCKESR